MTSFPVCVTCKLEFRYKGPKPKLLPCLHPVCDDCVNSGNKSLKCSSCQQDFTQHDTSIPRDTVREREIFHLTVKHQPSELLCTNKDDGNQAVSWCQDCREMFCEHCQLSHDEVKVTRGHNMKRLEDMVSIESWGEEPMYCQKHTDQKLEMYDKTCNQPLCFRCVYEDHMRHEFVGIKDYMVAAKEKVQGHLTFINQQTVCIEEGKSTLAQQGERLRERTGILRESVRQTFEELRTLVDQRQKEVLLALDQSVDTVEQQRKKSDQTLKMMGTEYKTKEEYLQASIGYLTSTEMVLNAEKILEATTCNNTDLPSDDSRDASIVFNRGHIEDIKSFIRCFGSVLSLRDQNNKEQVTVNIGSGSKAYRGNMEQSEAGGLQAVAIARSDKELWYQILHL